MVVVVAAPERRSDRTLREPRGRRKTKHCRDPQKRRRQCHTKSRGGVFIEHHSNKIEPRENLRHNRKQAAGPKVQAAAMYGFALDASVEPSPSIVFFQCSGRHTQTSGNALISPLTGGE